MSQAQLRSISTDKSGFQYFQTGLLGQAHQLAHELLDDGRFAEGADQLGAFLSEHAAATTLDLTVARASEWVHLHWHMAVFEIGIGEPQRAHRRFRRFILPAVEAGLALTDGPSLLWRLSLAGFPHDTLEWSAVRRAAMRHRSTSHGCYVQLHHVLAFAGARDTASLDAWLNRTLRGAASTMQKLLLQVAWALRLYASADFDHSARLLEPVLGELPSLGGSHGQNRIFGDVQQSAAKRWREELAA